MRHPVPLVIHVGGEAPGAAYAGRVLDLGTTRRHRVETVHFPTTKIKGLNYEENIICSILTGCFSQLFLDIASRHNERNFH